MNQILFVNENYICSNFNKKYKILYIYLFTISICISILILFRMLYLSYSNFNRTQKTNLLKNKYNISALYNSNINYTELKLENDLSIIGLINIPKIEISYPILSNTTEDLLKISVCRFAGPLPNRIGNLCIAGHNYKNNSMFSNLDKLKVGDSVFITDLNGTNLEYIIYHKLKVSENNLSCVLSSQNVEITLITCNNTNNKERIIIKAKMKG